jgi:hypothetical protein
LTSFILYEISFGLLFFSSTVARCLSPLESIFLSLTHSKLCIEKSVHTILRAQLSAMNGETELKTYFVGDLKHNAVNYDFFSLSLSLSLSLSVFIRDFLFSRCCCPDPSVTFLSRALVRSRVEALALI